MIRARSHQVHRGTRDIKGPKEISGFKVSKERWAWMERKAHKGFRVNRDAAALKAILVFKGVLDHRDFKVNLVYKDILAAKEILDHKDFKANLVHKVFKAFMDFRVILVHKVTMVHKDLTDHRDFMDHRDFRASKVKLAHKAMTVLKVKLVSKDFRALVAKAFKVHVERKDLLGL